MRPIICPKIGASPIRKNRAWSKNLWKQAIKWGFWAIFLAFSALYKKPWHGCCKILFCITVPYQKRIWHHLGELQPKNHPKAPQNDIFGWSENISTFIIWQPQMLYSWDLPGLRISMRPFIWHKTGASPTGGNWAWPKNHTKMPPNSLTFNFNLT